MFNTPNKAEQTNKAEQEKSRRASFARDCAIMFEDTNRSNNEMKANFLDISAIILYMRDYDIKEYALPGGKYIVMRSESNETYHLADV